MRRASLFLITLACFWLHSGADAATKLVIEEYRLPDQPSIPRAGVAFYHTHKDSLIPAILAKRSSWRGIKPQVMVCSGCGPAESDFLEPFTLDDVQYRLVRFASRHEHDTTDVEADFMVTKDDQIICRFTGRGNPTDNVAKAFFGWDHKWAVEYVHHVVVDGVDLNQRYGYSKSFFFRIIRGKPVYFADVKGRTRICFDGRLLPNAYDEVLHYLCCEPSVFNPGHWESMITFYAFRDGHPYYVEAGIYE